MATGPYDLVHEKMTNIESNAKNSTVHIDKTSFGTATESTKETEENFQEDESASTNENSVKGRRVAHKKKRKRREKEPSQTNTTLQTIEEEEEDGLHDLYTFSNNLLPQQPRSRG